MLASSVILRRGWIVRQRLINRQGCSAPFFQQNRLWAGRRNCAPVPATSPRLPHSAAAGRHGHGPPACTSWQGRLARPTGRDGPARSCRRRPRRAGTARRRPPRMSRRCLSWWGGCAAWGGHVADLRRCCTCIVRMELHVCVEGGWQGGRHMLGVHCAGYLGAKGRGARVAARRVVGPVRWRGVVPVTWWCRAWGGGAVWVKAL